MVDHFMRAPVGRIGRSDHVVAMAADMIVSARRWLAGRRDRRRLAGLPGHILKDIGIDRSEIDSVVTLGKSDTTRRQR